GKITIACFDKTGTLTAGKPQVTDVIGFDRGEGDVLRFAAALESGSSHPLATAILSRATEQQIKLPPTSNATAIGGKGV
ncbi:HAD family hydrolase, partial [Klebsiella pneumoniae]|nr:HAD family hydrolase [Klebsiella pneumoniae]